MTTSPPKETPLRFRALTQASLPVEGDGETVVTWEGQSPGARHTVRWSGQTGDLARFGRVGWHSPGRENGRYQTLNWP